MLTYVPSMRISARDALDHDWIQTYTKEQTPIDVPSLDNAILNIR